MEDKIIKCKNCSQDFIFSVGEQNFFTEKGFNTEPKMCLPCRRVRKQQRIVKPVGLRLIV